MLGCVAECNGCDYVAKLATICTKLVDGAGKAPAGAWRRGTCPYATHIKRAAKVEGKMVNPLKASKRGGH